MNTRSQPQCVVVLGALSTIGEALSRQLASEGARLVLAGRNKAQLDAVSSDLVARGASSATSWPLDFNAVDDVRQELERMIVVLSGKVDGIVLMYGYLGDNKLAESSQDEADRILDTNFVSATRWCLAAAEVLERQKSGILLAVSSVAGDRGRQSNYIYGASKSGLTVLMQGLAHRLSSSGAGAVVAKLGFVDTAMTAHIPKSGPLWVKPESVALRLKSILQNPKKPVYYIPTVWRVIMGVVRNLPHAIMHRTKL